jgi:DNA-binding SARP family transcriptional activator/predicted ATPase
MPKLEIYLFGQPHIELDGNPVNLKSHKAIGMIAYLAILNKRLSREMLASIFWPQDDQSAASGSLRTTLWRINKSGLKEWFSIDRETVRINYSNNLNIDAVQFINLIEKSANHGHAPNITCNQCIPILEEIVTIYNTGFMQSYYINDSSAYEEWQLFQQERMRFLFSSAIGRLVNAYRNRGDMNNALTYAQHWLMIDPYHDEANRLLMQLYVDAGQRESALNHYDEYVRILKRDLKISPDESITRIYHKIKSGISTSNLSKRGSPVGVLFHVNFSTLISNQESAQDFNLEDLTKYTDYITDLINRFGGKNLNTKLDQITAVFIDGDPLNCAIMIQSEHRKGLRDSSTARSPSIIITTFEIQDFTDLLNSPGYSNLMRISQSAWDGQILITPQVLAKYDLPKGGQVVDLGVHSLNDLEELIHLLGLTHQHLIDFDIQSPFSLSISSHNLPLLRTPFIGREYEISLINSLIQSPLHPLISIVGPGGIGKTRLALQVVALNTERFVDGVYFIPLDTITKPDQFLGQLSDTINFRLSSQGKPEDQIINYLVGKHILLLLDNFENLIDGSSILIELIQRLPALKIILTSRERLNLKMEWVQEIQGLSYPLTEMDQESDVLKFSACQLFIQSARRVSPEFDPDEDHQKCIAQICRTVDGSPLAIELAAAMVRSLTCCEIIAHIQADLDFLSSSMRDLPDRHRSLRVVFEQSWSLLSEEEQKIISRLSIFRGSFQRAAAEQIADASILTLAGCIDKSILRHSLDGRFEMPETIRYFAEERLNASADEKHIVTEKFYKYYSSFSQDCEAGLLSHDQLSTLEKVRDEIKNIAHVWSLALQTSNFHILEKFINTVFLYHEIKCLYQEGVEYFRNAWDAINRYPDPTYEILKIRLQARLGWYLFHLGYYEEGLKYLEDNLPLVRNFRISNETAFILNQLGDAYRMIGEIDRASEYISESISICEGEDLTLDPYLNFSYAQALLQLGALHTSYNQLDQAKSILLKSIDEFERAGNLWWAAKAYGSLSFVMTSLEDYAEAKVLREKNLAISHKTGDQRGVAVALNNLAGILEKLGKTNQVIELLTESLQISKKIGDRRFASIVMQNLAQAYLELNSDFFEAEKYHLDSIDTFKEIGDKRGIVYALYNYACALLDRGDLTNARYYYRESLKSALALKEISILLYVLSGLTRLFFESGDYEKAAELCGYLQNHSEFDMSNLESVNQVIMSLQTKIPDPEYVQMIERGKSKELTYFIDYV